MRQRIFSLLLLFLLALTANAQSDLAIGRVLDGRYRKNPSTSDITIQGERVKDFGLVLYHSLTVTDDEALMDEFLTAFLADQGKVEAKDLSYVGEHLYYGFFQYKVTAKDLYNRYSFIKDMRYAPQGREPKLILIYMEGPASLQTLKSKFGNR